MLTLREYKSKNAQKTLTELESYQFDQFAKVKDTGRQGFKEWLTGLTPHTQMEFEETLPGKPSFTDRCNKYCLERACTVTYQGHATCIEAFFSNGAEAMWSRAGHLAFRNDMRI